MKLNRSEFPIQCVIEHLERNHVELGIERHFICDRHYESDEIVLNAKGGWKLKKRDTIPTANLRPEVSNDTKTIDSFVSTQRITII